MVPAKSIEELQKQLERVLKEMHVPGMSITIVHRDGPEWIAGLGQADVASGQAATKETLFRYGREIPLDFRIWHPILVLGQVA